MVKHTYTSAHPYIHCIVYIYLSPSLFFYCLYMHMVSIGFPSHSDGLQSLTEALDCVSPWVEAVAPQVAAGNRLCHAGVSWLWLAWHGMLVVGWKMGFYKQHDATSNLDLCNGNHGNQETTGIWATNMGVRESWGPPLFRSKFPRRMLPFASLRSLAVLTSRPHGRSFALFAAKLVDADALKHLVHKARQPPKLGRPLKQALSDKAFNATERGRWNLWRDLWGKPYTRIYQVSLSFLRIYFHRFNLLCLRAL